MKNRNIEEQLTDKLGSRSIKPSEQAWDRIVLNRQQGRDKKQKKRIVIYYAASIVLLMFFSGYFFVLGTNNDIETVPGVVKSDKEEKIINNEKPIISKETMLIPEKTEAVVVYKEVKKEAASKNLDKEAQQALILLSEKFDINKNLPEINVEALPVVNVKTYDKDEHYEQEAAYLINNAKKAMTVNRQLSAPVNDTALLKEVEAEMDEYYREKALRIFSLKHKAIRIAVKDKQ